MVTFSLTLIIFHRELYSALPLLPSFIQISVNEFYTPTKPGQTPSSVLTL